MINARHKISEKTVLESIIQANNASNSKAAASKKADTPKTIAFIKKETGGKFTTDEINYAIEELVRRGEELNIGDVIVRLENNRLREIMF